MENLIATWHLSLDVECPNCSEDVNLVGDGDFWNNGIQPCETYTQRTHDVPVVCPICNHEFIVDLEY